MSKPVSVGLIQMSCQEDPDHNMEKARLGVAEAARRGARIVCLQELFRTRYFCQSEEIRFFDLAEPIPGPSTEILGSWAREHGIYIVGSLFERRAPGIYHNTAVLLDPEGKLAGRYRKMHIPDDPHYYEKFYFTPGDLGFPSFPTCYGGVGLLVCWDQWFPEAARLTTLQGAEIVFYPTAIGWMEGDDPETRHSQHAAWEIVQRGHAVANGIFVAVVNRVGKEGALQFWGQSFVADPFGQLLARASAQEEEVLVVECDLGRVEQVRRHWPFLRDRRIDDYQGLTLRFLDRNHS